MLPFKTENNSRPVDYLVTFPHWIILERFVENLSSDGKSRDKCLLSVGIFVLFLFSSCDIINPEEDIPSFIEVKDFQLMTDPQTEGSNQHQINDVWAFVEGEALGVFELPATIPILATGNQTITLLAGIRENGLRSAPVIYPFYERYEEVINLVEGQTITVTPTINYVENSAFEFQEDFETTTLKLERAIQRTTESSQIKEGIGAGRIKVDQSATVINSSITFIDLPTEGGLPVFLEMDYRTTLELEVGLIGFNINAGDANRAEIYKVTLCPIDQWNKVYINFQEELAITQFSGYQLAFRASTNDTGCGNINSTNPEVLLDNLKLIRFQP